MEKRILKSMVNYVLDKQAKHKLDKIDLYDKIQIYANFLSMPLKVWMFVPCDEDGNVLPESNKFRSCEKGLEYGKALENVIFEGFELKDKGTCWWMYNNEKLLFKLWKDDFMFESSIGNQMKKINNIESIVGENLILKKSAITKYQI